MALSAGRLVVLVAAASAVAGCDATQSAPRNIAIGFASVSGRLDDSLVGAGIQLAIDQLNSEAESTAIRFTMRTPPSAGSDPVRAAAQLRDDPDVVGVVGSLWSQEMLDAAAEYGAPGRARRPPVVAIAPVATNHDLSGISPWVFRLAPTDSQEAIAAARFIFDSLHSRRAVVLFANDAYGRDWSRSFTVEFRRLGAATVIAEPITDSPEDWELYASFVRWTKADVVAFPSMNESNVMFLGALRAAGVRAPVVSGDAAAAARGKRVPLVPAVYYTETFLAERPPGAEGRQFVAAHRKRFPDRSAVQAPAYAYDAAYAIGKAALAVGPNRDRIRVYLESLGTQRAPLAGATGPIAFDASHDATRRVVQLVRLRP